MALTIIKAWCPVCGEQNLCADDVVLHTFRPTDRAADRAFYEFVCTGCMQLVQRPADVHAVRALRLGRVPEKVTDLPGEMLDPKRDWSLPIRPNDVLDFINEMVGSDFLAELS